MRRKDRLVSDLKEIFEILKRCEVCHLAFYDEEFPYIVPLNFGAVETDRGFELYFHGAKVGKKLDLLRNNPHVGFSMSCAHKLIEKEEACEYTMEYESVCGNGILEELEDEYKIRGLNILMKQYTGRDDYTFQENELKAVVVLRLTVKEINGKRLKK
ncbi:MAG: pyridoxamine 5'-phosphate oxidase family protein [Mobilitalea sp.]